MRYSIIGASIQQVQAMGATNIKGAPRTGIVFATLTPTQVQQLNSLGCSVSEIKQVKASTIAPPAPIAGAAVYAAEDILDLFGFEGLRAISDPPLYGKNCTMAIIDTGIRASHVLLQGRVVYSKNFSASPAGDGFNHGTNVASMAVAFAPLCNIVDIKVLDDDGYGTDEDVIMGLDEAISLYETQPEIAPWVINMSLGAPDDGNPNNPLRVACRAAIARGIWIVAAVGNDGPEPGSINIPAAERYVVAVGSAGMVNSEDFHVSSFSSRGPTGEGLIKPDGLMIGENLIMASSENDTATISKSGTSFATPMISAILLLYREGVVRFGGVGYPGEVPVGLDPAETELIPIEEIIDVWGARVSIKPVGAPAVKDNDYGDGVPFGPLMAQAVGAVPAVAISEIIAPILSLMMMGMVISAVPRSSG